MKILLFIGAILCATTTFSQVNWRKGGNNAAGPGGPAIGTNAQWNSPIVFRTFGIDRMRVNSTLTNNYNGFVHDVSGHVGIGLNNYFNPLVNNPLTMLHIQGPTTLPLQTANGVHG